MISRNFFTDIYPIKFLGEMVEFLDSKRRPVTESDRRAGNYPYYGANGKQGTIDDYIFDEPLVLLAEDGGHFGNPERGIAYQISGKTWVNNHAHVLRPKENIDLAFLCRVLENYDVTPFVTGTTRGKLTQAGAAGIPIPIPPIAEQKRIAEILDRTQSLISKRKEAIAKLDTLTQSIFLEMFGDPVTNQKKWKIINMSECAARIQIGPFGTQLHEEDYIDNGIPLINPTHIKNGKIFPNSAFSISSEKHQQLSQYHLEIDDVILGRRGEMGRCAIISENENGWLCGTGSLFIRPKHELLNSFYLFCVLSSQSIKKYLEKASQGVTMANLNKTIVSQIPMTVPPLPLQKEFAQRVEAVEKLKATHRASLSQLEALFASLQHRAFRGEL